MWRATLCLLALLRLCRTTKHSTNSLWQPERASNQTTKGHPYTLPKSSWRNYNNSNNWTQRTLVRPWFNRQTQRRVKVKPSRPPSSLMSWKSVKSSCSSWRSRSSKSLIWLNKCRESKLIYPRRHKTTFPSSLKTPPHSRSDSCISRSKSPEA